MKPPLKAGTLLDASPRLNWLFLDLNSYFASVEQQLRPELRDRPIAVVPVMAETTCNRVQLRVQSSVTGCLRMLNSI